MANRPPQQHPRSSSFLRWSWLLVLSLVLAACDFSDGTPTPTPTRTPRPTITPTSIAPPAGTAVRDWTGKIFSYPQGDRYDDYFLRQDNNQTYGITPRDTGVARQISLARDSNRTVSIDGVLYANVGDVESRRIVVDSLRAQSLVFVPNPEVSETPPVPTATESAGPPPVPTATATPTPEPLPTSTPEPLPTSTPQPLPTPTPLPVATPTPLVITDWRGDYYANNLLAGTPTFVRNDQSVSFDWGLGAPAPGIPADNFSVRWTGTFFFPAGSYRFSAYADDGIRLYLDGILLINEWHIWQDQVYASEFRNLGQGRHTVTVEYTDFGGQARVWARWDQIGTFSEWAGEYFNSTQPGSNRAMLRYDSDVNFDWGYGSPDSRIRPDDFSARWTASIFLQAGNYRFWVRADDGIRLWMDNALIVSEWYDGVKEMSTPIFGISEDYHLFQVEYYERVDRATVRFWWEYLGREPGQPIP